MDRGPQNHFPHLLELIPTPGDATKQTLELLWRAAPEQVAELDQIFAEGIQARIQEGRSPEIGVTFNVLQIPTEMLQQLWLLSHAAWQDFLNFQERKEGNSAPEGKGIIENAVAAAQDIATGRRPDWPPGIPAFQEVKEGIQAKAVREVFAMSCAWAVSHEMRHAKFFESGDRPNDLISEELMCDEYASDFLLSNVPAYSHLTGEEVDRVRAKRAISALVGLYFVAKLSPENSTGDTHPSMRDRIKILFDKVGDAPAAYFWNFALAILCELKPAIAYMRVELPDPTPRDLAYVALEYFG